MDRRPQLARYYVLKRGVATFYIMDTLTGADIGHFGSAATANRYADAMLAENEAMKDRAACMDGWAL